MITETAAQATVETWFLAHEADLANPSNEGEALSAEQLAGLETALQKASVGLTGVIAKEAGGEPMSADLGIGISETFLGFVIGTCFGRNPTLQMLHAAKRLVSSAVGWVEFSAAAASQVGSDGPKLATLMACLQELVHAFTWAPRRVIYTHRDNMCVLVDRYRLQPRLDDLWSARQFRTMLVKHEPAFDAMRLSDPASFLKLLDAFPHPEPGRHILGYAANRMDLNDLLELLTLAPPCFEANNWLPRIKTPLLIVAACPATIKVRIPDNQDEKVVAGLVPRGGRSPTGGASPATTGDKALPGASIVM